MPGVKILPHDGTLTTTIVTVSDSTTRATAITPTAGTRIYIVTVQVVNDSATYTAFEAYFGTGANIGTTVANAFYRMGSDLTDAPSQHIEFPVGYFPFGDVDEVVSIRTGSNVSSNAAYTFTYFEE